MGYGGREQRPAAGRARLRDGAQPAVRAAARRPLGSSPVQEAARHPIRSEWIITQTKAGHMRTQHVLISRTCLGSQAGSQPELRSGPEGGRALAVVGVRKQAAAAHGGLAIAQLVQLRRRRWPQPPLHGCSTQHLWCVAAHT